MVGVLIQLVKIHNETDFVDIADKKKLEKALVFVVM
jgi:hypothetical protein